MSDFNAGSTDNVNEIDGIDEADNAGKANKLNKANKKPPCSPMYAEVAGGKGMRTQGYKLILFSVLVFAVAIFAVFNAIMSGSRARQHEQETVSRGSANIADPGRIRAELLADANASIPPPAPAQVEISAPAPTGPQIVVIQPSRPSRPAHPARPSRQARRRPRELSQEERAMARLYSEMRQRSLMSPTEVGGFVDRGNRDNRDGASPRSLSENLLQMYMAGMGNVGNVANNASLTQPTDVIFNENTLIQQQRLAFLTQDGAGRTPQGYSQHTRRPQLAPMELKAGTVIPGLLLVGVNSDLPGAVIGQVSENVFDTATGRYLLIPQGTRILGVYDSNIAHGQSRIAIVWNRLIYPDGSSLNIAGSPGTDLAGHSGMRGRVDNHYGRLLSAAFFTSVFVTAAEMMSPPSRSNNTRSPAEILAETTGMTITNIGSRIAERALNIQPTITLRPGTRFNVMVMQDIVFTQSWNPGSTQRTQVGF